MAIPTITTISPTTGHTGGQALVEIRGTGFRLPEAPASSGGPVAALPPSVRVFFGGEESPEVQVMTSELLYAMTPSHDPETVDVELRNVGSFGETIEDESLTALEAFTFMLPVLTDVPYLLRVCRHLIDELKRQVYPQVVWTQHTDYSDEPAAAEPTVVLDPPLPCLLLEGPILRKSEEQYVNDERREALPEDRSRVYRAAPMKDLLFTLGALSESTNELVAFTNALEAFMRKNQRMRVYVDDAKSGTRVHELRFESGGDFRTETSNAGSNVKTVSGNIAILGVPVGELASFVADLATYVDTPAQEVVFSTGPRGNDVG